MDVNNLTLPEGYQMPFSLEAEQAVLGCVLMDPNCMPQVLIYLRPEYFYLPQHKEIFSVMVSLDALGNKIDPLIILETLKNNGTYDEAAGKNYLFQLAQSVPTTSNVESYAKIVREKYFMRTSSQSRRRLSTTPSPRPTARICSSTRRSRGYTISARARRAQARRSSAI